MTDMQRWDEWFEAVGDEDSLRAWRAAKEVYVDSPSMLAKWGIIIEMNRLDRIVETTPHSMLL